MVLAGAGLAGLSTWALVAAGEEVALWYLRAVALAFLLGVSALLIMMGLAIRRPVPPPAS